MPPIDTDSQFKFLLCCIKHSAAGKVNFENVANELEIVSKAAAAKRYERLLKAHDIAPVTPRKGAGASKGGDDDVKTPASKKRKRAGAAKNEDDNETPVKKERAAKGKRGVKKEDSDDDVKYKDESDEDMAE